MSKITKWRGDILVDSNGESIGKVGTNTHGAPFATLFGETDLDDTTVMTANLADAREWLVRRAHAASREAAERARTAKFAAMHAPKPVIQSGGWIESRDAKHPMQEAVAMMQAQNPGVSFTETRPGVYTAVQNKTGVSGYVTQNPPRPTLQDAAKAAMLAYEATRNPVVDVPWESLDPFVRTVATNAVKYVAETFSMADKDSADNRALRERANREEMRANALSDKCGALASELNAAHALLGEADMKMRKMVKR